MGFINFGKDLLPGLIKWSQFILKTLEFFKVIRDFVLYPISSIVHLFNFELHEWFRTYLFLGLLSYNTYNFSYRKICGHFSSSSLIRLSLGPERIKVFLIILYTIILWPIHIFTLFKHYYEKGYQTKHNVYTLWGKYIFWVFFAIIAIVFVNWTFVNFVDEIFNQ